MKKFRGIKLAFATTALMAAFALNAQAGYWAQNTTGWWYDWGNGTWPASSWQWIDGNSDAYPPIAELLLPSGHAPTSPDVLQSPQIT